jgi:hypothetical protein
MWELHRDQPPSGNVIAPTDTVTATPALNSGMQQKPYEFSNAFNTFTSSLGCPPGQPNVTSPFIGIPPASGPMTSPSGGAVAPPSGVNIPGAKGTPGVTTPGSGNRTKSLQGKVNGNNIANPNCTGNPNGTGNPGGTGNPNGTGNPGGTGNPNGTGNPGGTGSQNCTDSVNSNRISQPLSGSSNRSSQLKGGEPPPSTTLPGRLDTGDSGLALAIGKSGSRFQVGQQVTYALTPCHLSSANNVMIFITDTLSAGLTGLKSNSTNWQIVYNYIFGSGSMTVVALYTGPRTMAPGSPLPPFTFSGMLTAAAVPRLTSFGLVATVDGPSGSLGPLGSSGSLGSLGLSLNAKITGWAAAVDTLSVQ